MLANRVLEGPGLPDMEAVDEVARWTLLASRLGATAALTEVSPAMRELLDLGGLGVQMGGKPEHGEDPLESLEGQEEVHPADPAP